MRGSRRVRRSRVRELPAASSQLGWTPFELSSFSSLLPRCTPTEQTVRNRHQVGAASMRLASCTVLISASAAVKRTEHIPDSPPSPFIHSAQGTSPRGPAVHVEAPPCTLLRPPPLLAIETHRSEPCLIAHSAPPCLPTARRPPPRGGSRGRMTSCLSPTVAVRSSQMNALKLFRTTIWPLHAQPTSTSAISDLRGASAACRRGARLGYAEQPQNVVVSAFAGSRVSFSMDLSWPRAAIASVRIH
jgi:hypothetical protein